MSQTCINELATRPLLYTDTIKGEQICRDDMWAVSTDELNRQAADLSAANARIDELSIKHLDSLQDVLEAKEQMRLLHIPEDDFPTMFKFMAEELAAEKALLEGAERQVAEWEIMAEQKWIDTGLIKLRDERDAARRAISENIEPCGGCGCMIYRPAAPSAKDDPCEHDWHIYPETDGLEQRLADAELDARRYRFMRDENNPLERVNHLTKVDYRISCYHIVGGVRELKSESELDAAIDAALSHDKAGEIG